MDLSTLNQLNSTAVAYWLGVLTGGLVLTVWWFTSGPDHPAVALIVTAWTFVLTPGLAVPVIRRVPPRWFRVPAGERVIHRMLGVGVFGRLLERSGWNRRNAYLPSSLTRTRLPLRAQAARGGASAHGACFAIHALLAVLAGATGHRWGALSILLPGVVTHLYPVLLQRSILLRLQPLLRDSGATADDVVRRAHSR
jgi:hypothetical protein